MPAEATKSSTTELHRISQPKGKYLLVRNMGPGAFDIPREGSNWDSMEIYFMPKDIERMKSDPKATTAEHIVFETDRFRRKLAIIKTVFETNKFWESYDAIMIADDDVLPHHCTMTQIFDFFMTTKCRIGQPAVTQHSPNSGHMILVQNTNFKWRKINFTEIQCPIFTRDAMSEYLHIFDGTISQFGIDDYWSFNEWQKGYGLAVLDCLPMHHARPIEAGIAYEKIDDAHQEGINFLIKHRIPRFPRLCLDGVYAKEPGPDEIRLAMAMLGYPRYVTHRHQFTDYMLAEISVYLDKRSPSSRKF